MNEAVRSGATRHGGLWAERPPRVLAALLTLMMSCDYELSFGTLDDLDDGGTPMADSARPNDSSVLLDATTDTGLPDSGPVAPFSCNQRGPLYPVSDAVPASCPRSPGFRYALCSCADLYNDEGGLFADSYDSRLGAYRAGGSSSVAASLGAHLLVNTKAGAEISGSLLAGDGAQINGGDLIVGGHLWTGKDLGGTSGVRVGGNARLGGNVYVRSLTVGGELLVAESSQVSTDAGAFERATFTFPAPCDCRDVVDRAALIERASRDNDNPAIGLDPSTGMSAVNASIERTLPCGRYYVESISAGRNITLRVTGRVALYVREPIYVDSGASLTITLDDSGELDLFVAGGITAKGPVTIGSSEAASRVRLHFGMHNLLFERGGRVAASIHAPTSYLLTEGPFELFGAALVRRAGSTRGGLRLHYDEALAPDGCVESFCAQNDDCPTPLRCADFRCVR